MSATEEAAQKVKDKATLAEFAAIKESTRKDEQNRAIQDAYDMGASDVARKFQSPVEGIESLLSGQQGAQIGDAAFGTMSPKGAIAQQVGGDIPSWLADAIIGTGDVVSSGMDSVSNFFMDAALPTEEEDAKNKSFGKIMEESMRNSNNSVWRSAPSKEPNYLNANSPDVTKEEFKRYINIFENDLEGRIPMTGPEEDSAYKLMKSSKGWSDEEIKKLAMQKTKREQ